MYKQSHQLANVKIHKIIIIPNSPLSVYSLPFYLSGKTQYFSTSHSEYKELIKLSTTGYDSGI
jgi:hypothetical protein